MVPVAPEEAQLGGELYCPRRFESFPSAFFRTVSPAAPLGRRLKPTLGKVVGTQFSRHETLTSSLPFPTAFFAAYVVGRGRLSLFTQLPRALLFGNSTRH
jgi:hypothetical protein